MTSGDQAENRKQTVGGKHTSRYSGMDLLAMVNEFVKSSELSYDRVSVVEKVVFQLLLAPFCPFWDG